MVLFAGISGEDKQKAAATGGTTGQTTALGLESADAPEQDAEMNAKYEALVMRVRPGITRKQVEGILGKSDEEKANDLGQFNPQKAGQMLTILTWKGKPSIILSFINDRLSDGGTPGYDINKGFHGELPSDMPAEQKAKLQKALKGTGFHVDEHHTGSKASASPPNKKSAYDVGFDYGTQLAKQELNVSTRLTYPGQQKLYLQGVIKPYEESYLSLAGSVPFSSATENAKGKVDGFRQTVQKAGIDID
jgi:hypothetical protein